MTEHETEHEAWREAVIAQAQADFDQAEAVGDAETTLSELDERTTALQAEYATLHPEKDVERRRAVIEELQALGPQLQELRIAVPYLDHSDDELVALVENRKIEAEQLSSQVKQANDPRFLTSPTLAAKLEREARAAMFAASEAETALTHRQQAQRARAGAEVVAEKQALNDAADRNTRERIRMGRDPRAQLEAKQRGETAVQEYLTEQRERAEKTQSENKLGKF